jgi:hypothetical protein
LSRSSPWPAPANVHFTAADSQVLAEQVAAAILMALKK